MVIPGKLARARPGSGRVRRTADRKRSYGSDQRGRCVAPRIQLRNLLCSIRMKSVVRARKTRHALAGLQVQYAAPTVQSKMESLAEREPPAILQIKFLTNTSYRFHYFLTGIWSNLVFKSYKGIVERTR